MKRWLRARRLSAEPSCGLASRFARDGYVVIRGLLSPPEVERLAAEIEQAPELEPGPNPLTLDTMRFASNLFYGSPALRHLLADPSILGPVREILGPEVWVRWDQAVWKGPGAPLFPWHQDNGYTELAAEHVQVWLAMTSMNADNGGLAVLPGAHLERFDHRWIGNHVECFSPAEAERRGAVCIDAEPGDAVIFSSFLPHATAPNCTQRTRLAYVAEYLPCSVDDPSILSDHFIPG